MIVQCPNCKSQYDVQTNGSYDGITIRCGVCGAEINTNQQIVITPLDNSYGGYAPQRRKNNSKGLWFLLIAVIIAGVMIMTCPSKEQHAEKIRSFAMQKMNDEIQDKDGLTQGLAILLGPFVVDKVLDYTLEVDNYFIFNVGRIKFDDVDKVVTIGVFNNVILLAKPSKDNESD